MAPGTQAYDKRTGQPLVMKLKLAPRVYIYNQTRDNKKEQIVILKLLVDDILLGGRREKLVNALTRKLMDRYDMKDTEEVS